MASVEAEPQESQGRKGSTWIEGHGQGRIDTTRTKAGLSESIALASDFVCRSSRTMTLSGHYKDALLRSRVWPPRDNISAPRPYIDRPY